MKVNEERIMNRLLSMKDPDTQRDIVTIGLVQDLQVADGIIRILLSPPIKEAYRHEALAAAIRRELDTLDGVEKVIVTWPSPEAGRSANGAAKGDTVHLDILDNASSEIPFETDPMDPMFRRFNIAPEMGYGEDGPEELPSPEAPAPFEGYTDWPPVLQWEIDPADSSLESGEAHVRIDDWEYEIWWQRHPADLVYASIQALADDSITDGPERQHPMGRNVVVNLVYDLRREAVIAVYGTTRDFRPFIEALRIGCNLEQTSKESDE